MTLVPIIYMRKAVLPPWRRGFFVPSVSGADKSSQMWGNFRKKFKNPLINAEECGIV